MSAVFDADVVSTFAKIGRLGLLRRVFGRDLLLPNAVYEDLARARDAGYDYVAPVLKEFQLVGLRQEEADFVKKLTEKRTLGLGELEGIAICKHRRLVFVTNDAKAKAEAEHQGVSVVNLGGILWHLKIEKVLSQNELARVIREIEEKDHTLLVGKEELLKD